MNVMTKKFLRTIALPALIFGSLMFSPSVEDFNFSSTALAEIKTYTGIGESQMSEIETADIVKLRAREKAVQNAIKQAGVMLRSYSRTVNSELTDDEISAITSTKYEMLGEPSYTRVIQQVTDVTTAVVWKATVSVNVDDEEIQNWRNLDSAEKAVLIKRTKENLKNAAENDKKIEDIRQRYLNAKTNEERAQIKAELQEADKMFLAIQKFEEGVKFYDNTNYHRALECYSEAINLNPDYVAAYYERGRVYFYDFEENEKAMENFTKAIQIQPNYDEAYEARGIVYRDLDQYDKAIADFDKAIKITPKFADAYSARAFTYYLLKDYNRAIEDYSKAIQIRPNKADNYQWRSKCYEKLGEVEKAQADLKQYEYWDGR